MNYEMDTIGTQFRELLSLSEAAETWGLEDSTIRKAIKQGRLVDGQDCRKFGKQWVVTVRGMAKTFSRTNLENWGPWTDLLVSQRKAAREKS